MAASLCGLSARTLASGLKGGEIPPLPDPSRDDYWNRLRDEQFLLPPWRAFLNNGSVGVTPRPVLKAVTDGLETAAEYATDDVYRWGYEPLDDERAVLAGFLGCEASDLAFTHNCTEAMNFVANGLDLKAGDEVILTNQEHPGGYSCWRLKAARYGINVREVEIPVTPRDPGELTSRLIDAIGPRTRVLSFSGITTHTGLRMPVREICDAARTKGVLTVVDGAHLMGQSPVQLRDLGCDFCAGSPHKWMFAPAGCGFLYGRGGQLDDLWPTIANAGWERRKGAGGARFMMVGTNNRAIVAGMVAGVKFIQALGPDRVFARTRQLADHVVEQVGRRRYLELVTPKDPRCYHAMVSFKIVRGDIDKAMAAIQARKINLLGGGRPRISCHIHTRLADLDALFEAFDETLGKSA